MNQPGYFQKFSFWLLLFSVGIWLLGHALFTLLLPQYMLKAYPFQVVYFFLVTLLFHRYIVRISRRAVARFTPRYLGATAVKMLFYMASVGIYLIIDSSEAVVFLVCFFVLYLFYTIFEVRAVLSFLKKKPSNS